MTTLLTDTLPSILLALVVFALPILIVIEAIDAFLVEANLKAHWWAKAIVRLGPPILGVSLVWLLPEPIMFCASAFGAPEDIMEIDSTRLAIPLGIIVGFVATVLHSWGMTNLLGAWFRSIVGKKLNLPPPPESTQQETPSEKPKEEPAVAAASPAEEKKDPPPAV